MRSDYNGSIRAHKNAPSASLNLKLHFIAPFWCAAPSSSFCQSLPFQLKLLPAHTVASHQEILRYKPTLDRQITFLSMLEMRPLLLPFSLSYIVLTPNRVRLPGERSPSTQPPPPSSSGWSPSRWSKAIGARIRPFRYWNGARVLCSELMDVSSSTLPMQGVTEFGVLYDQNFDGQDVPDCSQPRDRSDPDGN
ncbi:hypothetical protein M378DRAFT_157730 [Amanita muscaria Koide BX008]|uniref:Uncharacterized protein n=1 Tax=Amanita muscaria (strain Koide BX008) TaxID=946122 RepID=A0A0C2T0X7_AMAMK|nr:hypothetical protein M378DRAFT_157730 [Amanita muscaria Koide BX008]